MVNKFILLLLNIDSLCTGFSLQQNRYLSPSPPGSDIIKVTPQQCSLVSKHWYNKLMEEFYNYDLSKFEKLDPLSKAIQQKDNIETFPNSHIIKQINQFESYYHSANKNNLTYLAWMPIESSTKQAKDILALIICQANSSHLTLKLIIPNPHWSSNMIEPTSLKTSLFSLVPDSKVLNLVEFYENPVNTRFFLDWNLPE